jgi:septum formation protein
MRLILASQSAARRAILTAAGVEYEAMAPMIDEEAFKSRFREQGISPRNLADALAELKALKLSKRFPADLVVGCDQTLALDDGTMLDKASSLATLKAQMHELSGRTHSLWSALVVAQGGVPIWRHVEQCKMMMRDLSPDFIDDYLAAEGAELLNCVGGYRFEGRGVQLFSRIEGSHFAILGLPLLPLLDMLRTRNILR